MAEFKGLGFHYIALRRFPLRQTPGVTPNLARKRGEKRQDFFQPAQPRLIPKGGKMTAQEFIAKWQKVKLSERSACQQHFLDLCELLDHPKPAAADPEGVCFTFERGCRKLGGKKGWADVWKKDFFGWEYKGKHKDLNEAYKQLVLYRESLDNPPLLVVCDMDRFEVHTNFTRKVARVYAFSLTDLADNLETLRKIFFDPDALSPAATREGITADAAERFGELADGMRVRGSPRRGPGTSS